MKRFSHVLLALLFLGTNLRADEQVRAVQRSLKDQGFYYGEVDGEEGSETYAALRRYQIRNGLDVTGKLNSQTLASLGLGKTPAAPDSAITAQREDQPGRSQPPPSPSSQQQLQPPPARPPSSVIAADRDFLRRARAPAPKPSGTAAPELAELEPERDAAPPESSERTFEPTPAPPAGYATLFARSPYAGAPGDIQRTALRRVQGQLYRMGIYRGAIDGIPGPQTRRAITAFQIDANLRPTGRLDTATLAELGVLPGRRIVIPAPRRYVDEYDDDWDDSPGIRRRIFRGIWIR